MDELNEKIKDIILNIQNQYLFDDGNMPWLIGYSGGKDSTCTAQLVFRAVQGLKEKGVETKRQVSIFSSDTMIENPLVKEIVDNNIEKINEKAQELSLPIDAFLLKPRMDNTFWVNIIGKGYPNPNTMFRWCTDRLKIEPANSFVKNCIDKNGEVIMVLGVREGESNTRDRVLKAHSIEGERLMKHTSLTNAYVFAPIKYMTTTDVFMYLNEYESPWGVSNKKLYFFYEESGGGECPIFLSQQDKTSSNSCGNSRLGCWCCTVVSKDKSLTGFIETGWHEELKPLLQFRNWLASIRDDYDYRLFYRANGSVYTKKIDIKETEDGSRYLSIPQKGSRKKVEIPLAEDGSISAQSNYKCIEINSLSQYMKKNKLSFKDPKMAYLILFDRINGEYSRLGTGPYNEKAREEIFYKLIETEHKYNEMTKQSVHLIEDGEIEEIKKIWLRSSFDVAFIDSVLKEFKREKVEIVQDAFELMNAKYEKTMRNILAKNNLDYEVLNALVLKEKELSNSNNAKDEMQSYIDITFKADMINY